MHDLRKVLVLSKGSEEDYNEKYFENGSFKCLLMISIPINDLSLENKAEEIKIVKEAVRSMSV